MMLGKLLHRPPARRTYISIASPRSFSQSSGWSIARNISKARSAKRIASRICSTSVSSLIARSRSTRSLAGFQSTVGAAALSASNSLTAM